MGQVYILLGPEKGLKEDFIKKLKNSIGPCDVSKFYAFEDYEAEMFAQLNNNDLFASHKLVILDEAQEIKTKDKSKAIADYISNPSDCSTFLILSTELYINPDIMSAAKADNIIKFYELFENKKTEWLKNFFSRNGLSIQDNACLAITEKVENNIQEFEATCSQLISYICGQKRKIVTEEDVEDFLSHTRQETDFTLFGYVAHRKLESALECLHSLLNTNDETSMAAVMASRMAVYFRRLISIQMNVAKGMSLDEALKAKYFETDRAIVMPKDKEIYRAAFANYKPDDVRHILVRLAEYDIAVKEAGTAMSQIVMEKCLFDVIVKKGRPEALNSDKL